jgi:hypothetical protein
MKTRFLLVALVAYLASACSDDTGILVDVRGGALQVAVAKIETMVILDDGSGQPTDADWGTALRVSSAVEASQDLRTSPYQVLLQPGSGVAKDDAVWITALAYDSAGSLVGWGSLDAPVQFEPDLVKHIVLDLSAASTTTEGCVIKNGFVVVRTSDDCDRDGAKADLDCNDADPQIVADLDGDPAFCQADCDPGDPEVYPDNDEECDAVDNDCDDETSPPPEACAEVVREGDVVTSCSLGQRICNGDGTASASYGLCDSTPIDPKTNHDVCSYWADCNASGDASCLVDARLHCELGVADSAEPCVPAKVALGGFVLGDCGWRLVGNVQQGSWNVGLRPAGTDAPITPFSDVCDAELVVTAADLSPRVFVLIADTGVEQTLFSIAISPQRDDCDPTLESSLECEELP